MTSSDRVTQLLQRSAEGDRDAFESVLPLLYDELRRLAARQLAHERPDHTLQATALVHEAYLGLVDQRARTIENRRHFLSLAALAMRRVLLHHAEARAAHKRGGAFGRISLEAVESVLEASPEDFLDLEQALKRLERFDPRAARIVELRFFGGLSAAEAAEILELSPRTAEREWRVARAFLRSELARQAEA